MRRTLAVPLALLCSFGLLAACGDEDDGGAVGADDGGSGASGEQPPITIAPVPADDPDAPVTDPADGSADAPVARIVNPTPGLDGVVAAALDSVVALEGDKLEARFYGGVEGCYGVDRIEVSESDTDVTVTVFTGSPPEAAARSCIEIAELQGVIVALATPLGARVVIDGSSGAEVPLS